MCLFVMRHGNICVQTQFWWEIIVYPHWVNIKCQYFYTFPKAQRPLLPIKCSHKSDLYGASILILCPHLLPLIRTPISFKVKDKKNHLSGKFGVYPAIAVDAAWNMCLSTCTERKRLGWHICHLLLKYILFMYLLQHQCGWFCYKSDTIDNWVYGLILDLLWDCICKQNFLMIIKKIIMSIFLLDIRFYNTHCFGVFFKAKLKMNALDTSMFFFKCPIWDYN